MEPKDQKPHGPSPSPESNFKRMGTPADFGSAPGGGDPSPITVLRTQARHYRELASELDALADDLPRLMSWEAQNGMRRLIAAHRSIA